MRSPILSWKAVTLIGVILFLIVIAVLGRYEYRTLGQGAYLRIDRWTGTTETCTAFEPCGTKKVTAVAPSPSSLPYEEQAKVTGNARLDGYGTFSGKIYNGSTWTISKMIVQVITSRTLEHPPWNHYPPNEVLGPPAKKGSLGEFLGPIPDKQILWNRKFKVDFLSLQPLSTESFSVTVTGDEPGLKYSWNIFEVDGLPPSSSK